MAIDFNNANVGIRANDMKGWEDKKAKNETLPYPENAFKAKAGESVSLYALAAMKEDNNFDFAQNAKKLNWTDDQQANYLMRVSQQVKTSDEKGTAGEALADLNQIREGQWLNIADLRQIDWQKDMQAFNDQKFKAETAIVKEAANPEQSPVPPSGGNGAKQSEADAPDTTEQPEAQVDANQDAQSSASASQTPENAAGMTYADYLKKPEAEQTAGTLMQVDNVDGMLSGDGNESNLENYSIIAADAWAGYYRQMIKAGEGQGNAADEKSMPEPTARLTFMHPEQQKMTGEEHKNALVAAQRKFVDWLFNAVDTDGYKNNPQNLNTGDGKITTNKGLAFFGLKPEEKAIVDLDGSGGIDKPEMEAYIAMLDGLKLDENDTMLKGQGEDDGAITPEERAAWHTLASQTENKDAIQTYMRELQGMISERIGNMSGAEKTDLQWHSGNG
ncbi:MAG: hypothetical protein VKJ06_00910 [Vampirovibrionales bacterium]|nr:hypothetical protein [Vampirovibrionales bacterium]